MGHPRIDGQGAPPGYCSVKFRESGNGQNVKQINIPIGTNISTTNKSYVITADGIYTDEGIKVDDLSLSSAQFTALDAIDVNDDSKIDRDDIMSYSDKSLAKEVNKELEANDSKYHVPIVEDSDGGFEMASVDPIGNFSIEFAHNEVPGYNKIFNIELPKIEGTPPPSVPSKTIIEQKSEQPEQPHQIKEPKSWWQFW